LNSAEAHQQQLEHQQFLEEYQTCSVCCCEYHMDEGGTEGFIGILPVSFCPTCFSGLCDMFQQYTENPEDFG
jgi:hypothetical protein